jgi:hypothetical protein
MLVDVEEECAGNVFGEIAGTGINRRRNTDRGKSGVKDYRARIFETVGQPRGFDKRFHGD